MSKIIREYYPTDDISARQSLPVAADTYMENRAGGITLKIIPDAKSVQYQPEDNMMMKCLQCNSAQYDYMKKHSLISKVCHIGTKQLDESMTLQSTKHMVNKHIKLIIGNMKSIIKGANTIANEYLRAHDQDIISSIILANPEYIPRYDKNGTLVIPIPRSELQFVFDRRLNMKVTCKETLKIIKRLVSHKENLTLLIASDNLANIPKLDPEILAILEEGANIDNVINNEYAREIQLEKENEQMLRDIAHRDTLGF